MMVALLLAVLAAEAPVDEALRAVELEAAQGRAKAEKSVEAIHQVLRGADCPKPRPCPACEACPAAPQVLIEVTGLEIERGEARGVAQAWSGGAFPELLAQRAFEIPLPAAEPPAPSRDWPTRALVAWGLVGAAAGALLTYLGTR